MALALFLICLLEIKLLDLPPRSRAILIRSRCLSILFSRVIIQPLLNVALGFFNLTQICPQSFFQNIIDLL